MSRAPVAYLLCGPSLAGKSTVAARLVEAFDAVAISADAINERRGLPFGGEGLPEHVWAETLRVQLQELHELTGGGKSVVVDDTLCYRWIRDRFREEARAAGLSHKLLLLAPSREDLLARHALLESERRRPTLSLDRLVEHLNSFEWPAADEGAIDITTLERQDEFIRTEVASGGRS
ncbi:MAG TPA: ATP-binding protein [Candidatus Eisenbacteria bacterium]